MPKDSVYLDYNATAPLRPEALAAINEYAHVYGNPSSTHIHGREARYLLQMARKKFSYLLGCNASDIIFTSGGSESNHFICYNMIRNNCAIAVSAIEHENILQSCETAQLIPVDTQGLVQLDALENWLQAQTKMPFVSIMLANNFTGVIQDIKTIADLVHKYNGLLHTDAIQAWGKMPVSVKELGVDFMSLSSHKIGGPRGVGAVITRPGFNLEAVIKGGGQERGLRSGTENVVGSLAFAIASERAYEEKDKWQSWAVWRQEIEEALTSFAGVKVFSGEVARLPNTLCITMPEMESEAQLINFDLKNISISRGAACASGKTKLPYVLQAMQAASQEIANAIRVSMGWQTSHADIRQFIEVWKDIYNAAKTQNVA